VENNSNKKAESNHNFSFEKKEVNSYKSIDSDISSKSNKSFKKQHETNEFTDKYYYLDKNNNTTDKSYYYITIINVEKEISHEQNNSKKNTLTLNFKKLQNAAMKKQKQVVIIFEKGDSKSDIIKNEISNVIKSKFLVTVSHEINNPFSSINQIFEYFLEKNEESENLKYFQDLNFYSEYINFFLSILSINIKIDLNQDIVQEKKVNKLYFIIDTALKSFKKLLEDNKIKIKLQEKNISNLNSIEVNYDYNLLLLLIQSIIVFIKNVVPRKSYIKLIINEIDKKNKVLNRKSTKNIKHQTSPNNANNVNNANNGSNVNNVNNANNEFRIMINNNSIENFDQEKDYSSSSHFSTNSDNKFNEKRDLGLSLINEEEDDKIDNSQIKFNVKKASDTFNSINKINTNSNLPILLKNKLSALTVSSYKSSKIDDDSMVAGNNIRNINNESSDKVSSILNSFNLSKQNLFSKKDLFNLKNESRHLIKLTIENDDNDNFSSSWNSGLDNKLVISKSVITGELMENFIEKICKLMNIEFNISKENNQLKSVNLYVDTTYTIENENLKLNHNELNILEKEIITKNENVTKQNINKSLKKLDSLKTCNIDQLKNCKSILIDDDIKNHTIVKKTGRIKSETLLSYKKNSKFTFKNKSSSIYNMNTTNDNINVSLECQINDELIVPTERKIYSNNNLNFIKNKSSDSDVTNICTYDQNKFDFDKLKKIEITKYEEERNLKFFRENYEIKDESLSIALKNTNTFSNKDDNITSLNNNVISSPKVLNSKKNSGENENIIGYTRNTNKKNSNKISNKDNKISEKTTSKLKLIKLNSKLLDDLGNTTNKILLKDKNLIKFNENNFTDLENSNLIKSQKSSKKIINFSNKVYVEDHKIIDRKKSKRLSNNSKKSLISNINGSDSSCFHNLKKSTLLELLDFLENSNSVDIDVDKKEKLKTEIVKIINDNNLDCLNNYLKKKNNTQNFKLIKFKARHIQ
jgi:hypothetical protein